MSRRPILSGVVHGACAEVFQTFKRSSCARVIESESCLASGSGGPLDRLVRPVRVWERRLSHWHAISPTFSRSLSRSRFVSAAQRSKTSYPRKVGHLVSTIHNFYRPGNCLTWPVRTMDGSSDGCSGKLRLEPKQKKNIEI